VAAFQRHDRVLSVAQTKYPSKHELNFMFEVPGCSAPMENCALVHIIVPWVAESFSKWGRHKRASNKL